MNDTVITLRDLIFHNGQDPDHPAIESPGYVPLTFRELRTQVDAVIRTLNAMDLHPRDRVAVVMPPGPATAVMIIAAMTGFTCIPLNPRSTEQEYESYFAHLRIRAVVVQEGDITAARAVATGRQIRVIELIPDPAKAGVFRLDPTPAPAATEAEPSAASDIAALFLTSGTTSLPKIIPYPQRLFCENAQLSCTLFHYSGSDRCLQILPYYHLFGVTALLFPLSAGGTVICTQDFIPPDFFHLVQQTRPTCYWGVPALHLAVHSELEKIPPEQLRDISLRFIGTASSYMPDTVRNGMEAMLKTTLVEVYGMSEAVFISVNNPCRRGSVGIPVVEFLKIADADGRDLPRGEEGEIVIKGERVFSGYENAPEENAAVFSDGWFRTGDRGFVDADGYLFITGRVKELINKGGEKISPAELDHLICSHPGVLEAMAFPVRDPVLGEDVAVMVVRKDETVSEDDIRRYLLGHLAPFKIPRRIWFVDAIPKTATGKPIRSIGTQQYP